MMVRGAVHFSIRELSVKFICPFIDLIILAFLVNLHIQDINPLSILLSCFFCCVSFPFNFM